MKYYSHFRIPNFNDYTFNTLASWQGCKDSYCKFFYLEFLNAHLRIIKFTQQNF